MATSHPSRVGVGEPTHVTAHAVRRKVLAIHVIQWLAIALIMVAPLVLDGAR